MKGFLSLEFLIVLLALVSTLAPLAETIRTRGVEMVGELKGVTLAKAALAEVRVLVEKAIVEGRAEGDVTFPSGTLKTGNAITLEVNGETFSVPAPLPTTGGPFNVDGTKRVEANVSGGIVEVKIT